MKCTRQRCHADHHRSDGTAETSVYIRDHQLHHGEASGPPGAQKRRPERAVFAVADIAAHNLTITITGDASRDDHRPRHHPAADTSLDVGDVEEDVGELDMAQRAGPARFDSLAELGTDSRHRTLGDPGLEAQRRDQIIDLRDRYVASVVTGM